MPGDDRQTGTTSNMDATWPQSTGGESIGNFAGGIHMNGLIATARLLFATCLLAVGIPAAASSPTIMVLLDERISGVYGTTATESMGHAENVIASRLRTAGFRVLDPATVRANTQQAKGLRLMEGDERAAAAIGLQNEADYSVIGTALSKPSATKLFETRMQSLQATVSVRVVRNDDAQTVASAQATATKAHIDEVAGGAMALEEAAALVADQVSQQLTPMLAPSVSSQSLMLNISGLVSYRHLDFVMGYFENDVENVSSVSLGSFTEGIAVLNLQHTGSIEEIARAVARKKFKGFRLEPTTVTANRMDLAAVLEQ